MTPAYDGPERREAARRSPPMPITVREAGRHQLPAALASLSHLGCGITGVTLAGEDGAVWIRLPGLESQPARCAWKTIGAAGFEFERPLHPAVADKLCGGAPAVNVIPLPLPDPVNDIDRPASRRDQIIQGLGQLPHALLSAKNVPENKATLSAMVRRHAARVVDQRIERRFLPPPAATLGFRVAGQPATIRDVSASGIKLADEIPGGIGAEVSVAFAGFDPMPGSIVWVRHGQTGLRLPDNALDLFEAA
jgi:hypothetical protein